MTGFTRSAALAAVLVFALAAAAQASGPGGKWSKDRQQQPAGASPAVTGTTAPPVAGQYGADGAFVGAAGAEEKSQPPPAAGQDAAAVIEKAVTPAPAAVGAASDSAADATAPAPVVAETPPDPCAPYAAYAVNYEACLDRMKKIQRMRDASTQRDEDLKAYYKKLENKTAPKKESETPAQ